MSAENELLSAELPIKFVIFFSPKKDYCKSYGIAFA